MVKQKGYYQELHLLYGMLVQEKKVSSRFIFFILELFLRGEVIGGIPSSKN